MKRNRLIKIFAIMMIAILSLGTLASCGKKEADSKKLKIVVTTFPEYDWVREILGDRVKDVDLKLLQKNGTDLIFQMLTFSSMLAVSQMNGLRTFSRRKRTRTSLQSTSWMK